MVSGNGWTAGRAPSRHGLPRKEQQSERQTNQGSILAVANGASGAEPAAYGPRSPLAVRGVLSAETFGELCLFGSDRRRDGDSEIRCHNDRDGNVGGRDR